MARSHLAVQLVEHCNGIKEVMGSNPVHPEFVPLGFNCTTAYVMYITAMINHVFLGSLSKKPGNDCFLHRKWIQSEIVFEHNITEVVSNVAPAAF